MKLTLSIADLDHISPRANGANDDPENLQFLYRPVNEMKRAMSEDFFLALVADIYLHCTKIGKIEID